MRLKEDLGKNINLEMIFIPASTFKMGSPETEKDRNENETLHKVTITKSFFLGIYTVTQEQWEAVMGNNPSNTKGSNLPVTNISWEDCQDFIKKLNAKTNGGYRLPMEAEWEYACRAGTTTNYSFGDEITPRDANYDDFKIGKPVIVGSYKPNALIVGSYKPNAFSLYDMHGNVWEWCEDWKADYPEESVIDPKGPATGKDRALRGGSFYFDSSRASSFARNGDSPTGRHLDFGFRLAKTP
jgi:formylglycine-generating enzyme required for sulfatase activity